MNTYTIWEGNMEKLRAKCETIRKKCAKNGCTFVYREVGEQFEEYKEDGVKFSRRFILVEVEGTAIVNGWQFLATVQHLSGGKVITKADADIEIPNRFYSMDPICEHCNSKRARKDTYIVYNQETKEYKMVGKSCLREYTNGLSAELVASYLSYFEALEDAENYFPASYSAGQKYYDVEEVLQVAAETVKHFGYVPSSFEGYTTKARCSDYFYYLTEGWAITPEFKEKIRMDLAAVKFDHKSNSSVGLAKDIMKFIREHEADSEYIRNLQSIVASRFVSARNFGLLISAVKAYDREVEKQKREEAKKAERSKIASSSNFQGEVGQKLTFDAVEVKVLSCYENQWDYSYFYQMLDAQGNVYTWSTSKGLDPEKKYTVTGTVKKHEEYRGVKQTQLTRCKVTEIKEVA